MARQRFEPARGTRGTAGYEYYELSLALGPQQIGVTGDNSYETLYGRAWLMVIDAESRELQMWQRDPVDEGAWSRVTTGLPPLFGSPVPGPQKRFTFAFDQSARAIVVYEQAGYIYVTRWDPFTDQYIQNVTFAGVDPCLLMDATVADPRGYPNLADDGWNVREAYYAGLNVLYEWIPDGVFRDTPIPDSDIVLFYLTPDRLEVKARVQRQLYATVNDIHTFAEPAVMDRAVALSGKYQLLVSDAAGDKRANMLISGAYLGDFIITAAPDEPVAVTVAPEGVRVENSLYPTEDDDGVDVTVAPEAVRVESMLYPYAEANDVDATVAPEAVRVESMLYPYTEANDVDVGVTPEGTILVAQQDVPADGSDDVDITVAPESIRVQAA